MLLSDIFDIQEFMRLREDKYINVRSHPAWEDLRIADYSATTQFESRWNDVTLACRGLIYNDKTLEVIARPPDKFFNLGEKASTNPIQFDETVEVMDKMDGSMGIMYADPEGYTAIATRGSFDSFQARRATQILIEKYPHIIYDPWTTYYFEIIYPENRIVVSYGDMEDLVLLGARNIPFGYLIGPQVAAAMLHWTGPVVKTFEFNTISEALLNTARPNAEGFVIRRGSTLVKIKEEEYVRVHRLRFELTPLRIWENMSTGADMEKILDQLPDEFHAELRVIINGFVHAYAQWEGEILAEYSKIEHFESRKAFANAAKVSLHTPALFALRDGKSIDRYIWQKLRPRQNDMSLLDL